MSRVGKKAVPIPKGVTVVQDGNTVRAKGPLGELTGRLRDGMKLRVESSIAHVDSELPPKQGSALHGVSRAIVANLVEGVSLGFKREMEIVGTGYRVSLEGRKLIFKLNYDHPIEFPLPEGINAEVADRPPRVTIKGIDKYLVGQTAANIRRLQPPEPYKGKGIKYVDEQIRRKAGKSAG